MPFCSIPTNGSCNSASYDSVFVIDIRPDSEQFHKVIDVVGPLETPTGYISSMVVDASGTNLLLTAPATRLFTGSPVHDQFGRTCASRRTSRA